VRRLHQVRGVLRVDRGRVEIERGGQAEAAAARQNVDLVAPGRIT
jgi:hypothetical protein